MIYKNFAIILFSIFLLVGAVRADIAPDPGFKRVSVDLNVELKEDFSDYRFFLESAIDIREVSLKKDETNKISAMGGGAAYSVGTLWAIPKKNLPNEDLKELKKAVDEKKIEGAVELIKHNFTRTVPESETAKLKGAIYRLERDDKNGIKAVKISEENPANANSAEITSQSSFPGGTIPTAAAGFLIGLGIFFLGWRMFRRNEGQKKVV